MSFDWVIFFCCTSYHHPRPPPRHFYVVQMWPCLPQWKPEWLLHVEPHDPSTCGFHNCVGILISQVRETQTKQLVSHLFISSHPKTAKYTDNCRSCELQAHIWHKIRIDCATASPWLDKDCHLSTWFSTFWIFQPCLVCQACLMYQHVKWWHNWVF